MLLELNLLWHRAGKSYLYWLARRLRLAGKRLSTRRTRSAPVMLRALAISRIAVSEGLYLPLSRRLMYFGWYPLSKASVSCVIPRSSRRLIRTRANALFSRYARSSELPRRAIYGEILAQLNVWFHKLYYPSTWPPKCGRPSSGLGW